MSMMEGNDAGVWACDTKTVRRKWRWRLCLWCDEAFEKPGLMKQAPGIAIQQQASDYEHLRAIERFVFKPKRNIP
jgi:hypothetical protein